VAEGGSELTKSLELLAPTAPTPIVESMLSSYRIGTVGRIDIDDEAGQGTAVGEDGRKDKVKPDSKGNGCAGRAGGSVACIYQPTHVHRTAAPWSS